MPHSISRFRSRAASHPSPPIPLRTLYPLRLRSRLLALAVAAAAGTVLLGGGVAAMGSTLDEQQAAQSSPRPQSYSVGEQVAASTVEQAELFITWTPPLVYPLGAGASQSGGFGYRAAPCATCSNVHNGVDWNPGAGTPVVAMADGVVTGIGNPDASFGVFIEIEHVVDGRIVRTLSAHMQQGSLRHSVGDAVEVGEVIGAVGSTGQSTGAHLHFEVHLGGVPVDPIVWLRENVRTEPL